MNRVVDPGLENVFVNAKLDVVAFQKIANVKNVAPVTDVVDLAKTTIGKRDVINGKFSLFCMRHKHLTMTCLFRSRSKDRKRKRSKSRDRSERKKDRRDKDRDRKEKKPEFREGEIKIKEEPLDGKFDPLLKYSVPQFVFQRRIR